MILGDMTYKSAKAYNCFTYRLTVHNFIYFYTFYDTVNNEKICITFIVNYIRQPFNFCSDGIVSFATSGKLSF